jgi:hypothetical protein
MLQRLSGGVMGTEFGVEISKNSDPDGFRHGAILAVADEIRATSFELE